MDELSPFFKELTQYPAAFLGGFVSGILRLNLGEDPVRTWLEKQGDVSIREDATDKNHNGQNNGPQSISIE